MKLARLLVVAVLVLVGVALVWRFLPGCRHRIGETASKLGGWTEEARKADPVGFIEHAEKQLTAHLGQMQNIRRNMAEARERIQAEKERIASLQSAATDLAAKFKASFGQARGDADYPVEVAGARYSREQLVEQVRLVLLQQRNYGEIQGDLAKAAVMAREREGQLVIQQNNTQAALATLASKKEIARIGQLTGTAEKLLAQVDELIGENERVLTGSPVRTVEDLAASAAAPADTSSLPMAEVMAFLEGGE